MSATHSPKKDNSTFARKATLRTRLLKELDRPVVLESHGGGGRLYWQCYRQFNEGIVFEKNADKVAKLAQDRPTWRVYEADSTHALREGIGRDLGVNFFDLDPYGEPWPTIDAIIAGGYLTAPVVVFAVNDGLRQKLRYQGGWVVKSLADVVLRYGNSYLFDNYLEVAQELLKGKLTEVGYSLGQWVGYYCGHLGDMTHYGAVFVNDAE